MYISFGVGIALFGGALLAVRAKRRCYRANIVTLDKFLDDKGVGKVNEVDTHYARLWVDTNRKKMAILLASSSLYERPDIFAQKLPIIINFPEIDNWQHTWLRSSSGTSNNVLEIRTYRHDLPVIKVRFLDHSEADAFSQRLRIFTTPQAAMA